MDGRQCEGLTPAGRPPANRAVRSALPQPRHAAGCARLGKLRAVGRRHRAARVLADVRTRPCMARAVCDAVRACEGQTAAGERDRRTCGFRERRDGRELQYVLGLLAANCAEESLTVRKLGFATLDV
jgi:hypothetical protein